jgi:hypothetical protein
MSLAPLIFKVQFGSPGLRRYGAIYRAELEALYDERLDAPTMDVGLT